MSFSSEPRNGRGLPVEGMSGLTYTRTAPVKQEPSMGFCSSIVSDDPISRVSPLYAGRVWHRVVEKSRPCVRGEFVGLLTRLSLMVQCSQ